MVLSSRAIPRCRCSWSTESPRSREDPAGRMSSHVAKGPTLSGTPGALPHVHYDAATLNDAAAAADVARRLMATEFRATV